MIEEKAVQLYRTKSKEFARLTLDLVRISVSSIAASVLFKAIIAFIRTGNFGTGYTINQNNAAAKVEAGYNRQTCNGSLSFWRFSDLTNTNCTHFDGEHLKHPPVSTADIIVTK